MLWALWTRYFQAGVLPDGPTEQNPGWVWGCEISSPQHADGSPSLQLPCGWVRAFPALAHGCLWHRSELALPGQRGKSRKCRPPGGIATPASQQEAGIPSWSCLLGMEQLEMEKILQAGGLSRPT